DMYAHTYINYYTGAPFSITPLSILINGIKHVTIEGAIGKRTPIITAVNNPGVELSEDMVTIQSPNNVVRDFIFHNMIDAGHNPLLHDRLLIGPDADTSTHLSIPRVYSDMEIALGADIAAYY